jgi:hypothetical protein
MPAPPTTPSQNLSNPPSGSFRELLADAVRSWEPLRVFYNLALTAVVIIWIVASWPHFRPAFTFSTLPPVLGLGLIANVCYCAAYLVDIPMQTSSFASAWKRRRWILWLVGTLFAIVLANYWIADEIYPDVH